MAIPQPETNQRRNTSINQPTSVDRGKVLSGLLEDFWKLSPHEWRAVKGLVQRIIEGLCRGSKELVAWRAPEYRDSKLWHRQRGKAN